jgi:hypothetical protein
VEELRSLFLGYSTGLSSLTRGWGDIEQLFELSRRELTAINNLHDRAIELQGGQLEKNDQLTSTACRNCLGVTIRYGRVRRKFSGSSKRSRSFVTR